MKPTRSFVWLPAVLLSAMVQAHGDVTLPGAIYSTNAVISPSNPGTDYWLYEETSPGNLTQTNAPGQLTEVLRGHAGASGGNVELFAMSELLIYQDSTLTGEFASVAPVTLSGTAGSVDFTFRSLNGQDWFGTGSGYDTSYGAATLATEWFNDFITSVTSLMTDPFAAAGVNLLRANLFNQWRDAGGFASLSDANIGYVYQDGATGELNFGLEGFLDASPRFRQFMQDAGYGGFSDLVPDGIQYSEVVMVDEVPYYSFNNATASGVQLDDAPFHSYTGTFAFAVVPEPSGVMLAGFAAALGCLRRRR